MENRSTKAVADFFSTMLDEKDQISEIENQPLERLLAQVTPMDDEAPLAQEVIDPALLISEIQPQVMPTSIPQVEPEPEVEIEPQTRDLTQEVTQVSPQELPQQPKSLADELDDVFPVLYFSVGDITFAVPLIKLKAIHRLAQPTKIFGKPDWFSGIQVEREQNLGIVDTGKCLMPEKFNSSLEHSTNYKYIIVLGDSNWGLKCDALVDSENLSHDDIKWRAKAKSSPWLAGTVKQRMCGLLAVDALIEMFEQNTSV